MRDSRTEPFRSAQKRKNLSDDGVYGPPDFNSIGRAPKRRKTGGSSLCTMKKNDVTDAVAKAVGFSAPRPMCIVTRFTDKMTYIEYSHVIGPATPSDELTKLEWSWDMEAHTLDVDTSKNVQTLTSGLHRMFGKTVAGRPAGWFLQPAEPRIIANMHERYVGVAVNWPSPPALPESFPNTREDPDNFYAEERFSYRIFAFEGMKESQDVRVFTGSHTFGISNGDFFQYDFPFCVKFWSHVPYHFAIANSGQKLWALFGRGPIVLPKSEFTLALLTAMRNIYVAWQSSKPTVAFKAGLGANISSGLVHHSRPPRTRLQARSAARPSQPSETFQPTAACSSRTAADKRGKSGGNEGSLRPWDSASCRTAVGRAETDGDDDEAPFEDDEDAEYEDPEWLEWLQEWCRDVRRATEAEDSGSLPDCTPVAELP